MAVQILNTSTNNSSVAALTQWSRLSSRLTLLVTIIWCCRTLRKGGAARPLTLHTGGALPDPAQPSRPPLPSPLRQGCTGRAGPWPAAESSTALRSPPAPAPSTAGRLPLSRLGPSRAGSGATESRSRPSTRAKFPGPGALWHQGRARHRCGPPEVAERLRRRSPHPLAHPAARTLRRQHRTPQRPGWQRAATAPSGAGLPGDGSEWRSRLGAAGPGEAGVPDGWAGERPGTERCPSASLPGPARLPARSPAPGIPPWVRRSCALCHPWLLVRMEVGGCEHPARPCAYPLFTQGRRWNPPSHFGGKGGVGVRAECLGLQEAMFSNLPFNAYRMVWEALPGIDTQDDNDWFWKKMQVQSMKWKLS